MAVRRPEFRQAAAMAVCTELSSDHFALQQTAGVYNKSHSFQPLWSSTISTSCASPLRNSKQMHQRSFTVIAHCPRRSPLSLCKRREESGEPVVNMLVCFIYFAREAAGAAGTRRFLRPLLSEGGSCNTRVLRAARMRTHAFEFSVGFILRDGALRLLRMRSGGPLW